MLGINTSNSLRISRPSLSFPNEPKKANQAQIQTFPQKMTEKQGDQCYAIVLALKNILRMVKQLPCHQLLSFQLTSPLSCDNLMQVKASEMREALSNSILKRIEVYQSRFEPQKMNKLGLGQSSSQINIQLFQTQSEIERQLTVVLSNSIDFLRVKYGSKEIYQHLSLKFKEGSINDAIFKVNPQDQRAGYQSKGQNQAINNEKKVGTKTTNSDTVLTGSGIKGQNDKMKQLTSILSKLNCSLLVKTQLCSLFKDYEQQIVKKQIELAKWTTCSQEMKDIVLKQIKVISNKSSEAKELQQEVTSLRNQLSVLEGKSTTLEQNIARLQCDINALRTDSEQTVKEVSYYMNPYWEKDQIEEKLLVQVIELESDLLLSKCQIKSISEAMLQIIKIAHYGFEELQVSKYFKGLVDKKFASAIKHLKCFQNIDLDQILSLKQEIQSSQECDCMTQMGRSTMSTYSEVNIGQRSNQLHENQIVETIFQNDE